jgi:uncharacterized coiled-coil protein SlyX
MLRYNSGETSQKWTRTELRGVAGIVVVLLLIWGAISWKNYHGDQTKLALTRTRTQLAAANEKIASLESRLGQEDKQLAEANSKITELTLIAARAPQLPIAVKQWKDSGTTYAIALENQSDEGLSVHVTVSNPNRSRPREQDCYVAARRTINTPLRIFPGDTAILTADGFATRTEKMD